VNTRFSKIIISLLAVCILCTACKEPQEKYEIYIQRGDKLFAEADYIKARLEYKNAAKIIPSSASAIYKLGLIEEAEGNYQSALSAFLAAKQQDATFQPAIQKLAEFFIIAKQYEEAGQHIEALLALDPKNAQARALKASIFLEQRAFLQATSEVKIALKNDPSNVIANSVLSGIYIAQKQYSNGLETLEKAIKENPKELSLYLLKATIYSELNNTDKIVDTYNEIFVQFPEQITLRYDLANILLELGRKQDALDLYEAVVNQFPKDKNAKLILLRFMEKENGIENAKQSVQSFIKNEPKDKIYALWLADLYARNDELELAISTLKRIISTDPDNWIGLNAQTSLAQIQLSIGDIALAKSLIDIVLTKDVNNLDALFLNANLSFIQGDQKQAIAKFREILNKDPSYLKASRMLAETLLMQDRVDLAIDTLIQANKKSPGVNGTLVRLGQLYALRGESETGLGILTKITELDPKYALAWESIARIALENGKASTSEKAIKKLSNISGQETLAKFLQAKLDEQDGKSQQAVTKLKEIIRQDIDAPIARYALSNLIEISTTKQQLSEIAAFLTNLNTQNAASLTVLATILSELGNQDLAEARFRQAIEQKPKTQDPYTSLANLLLKQGETQKSLDILNAAEKAIPSEIKAPMLKAAILINAQDYDAAIAIYEDILARNDTVDDAANNMAQIIADYRYQNPEKLETARLIAERFINSDNPYYLDTLAWVYARQELFSQAQTILARSINLLNETNPQIDYHYGYVLSALGQKQEAKQYLSRALSSNHDYADKEGTKKLLDDLNQQPQTSIKSKF